MIFLTASEVNSVFDAKCLPPTDDMLNEWVLLDLSIPKAGYTPLVLNLVFLNCRFLSGFVSRRQEEEMKPIEKGCP